MRENELKNSQEKTKKSNVKSVKNSKVKVNKKIYSKPKNKKISTGDDNIDLAVNILTNVGKEIIKHPKVKDNVVIQTIKGIFSED